MTNLQLLEGAENVSKQAKLPGDWAAASMTAEQRASYLKLNAMPEFRADIAGFKTWCDTRYAALEHRLTELLGAGTPTG